MQEILEKFNKLRKCKGVLEVIHEDGNYTIYALM